MPTVKDTVAQQRILHNIAEELSVAHAQVVAAVDMLDGGATVPFIARYRKELTGALTDGQLRTLEERLGYLRDLEQRRTAILAAIESQGKLDSKLTSAIQAASSKTELEDLYLPYKQKRKTKGVIATEAGLKPLADSLWSDPSQAPEHAAESFVAADKGVLDVKAALDGAKYILMERFSEDVALITRLRTLLKNQAYVCSAVQKGKQAEADKFQQYFDYQERWAKLPSHRALAMFRGRSEGLLQLSLKLKEEDDTFGVAECVRIIARHTGFEHKNAAADNWRAQVVDWTWKIKLSSHLETELFVELRELAEREAIRVFASNLHDLLLAAPAGARATLGLDPGYRSGVKVAVVDKTGKLVDHTTIYPHAPQKQWDKSLATISTLCKKHQVELIAIGNGTASRETDQFASEVIKLLAKQPVSKVVVSEAGASVYSASVLAEREFPDLDVTIRGAVSIARRLQDPLAELVKIDPKAIGVGQYQHDVSQLALARSLDATVEDCVNSVGVDLNTASAPLLERVAGLGSNLAENIVKHRDEHGPFDARKALNKVPRLGPKAYEQCAGFLRITDGSNPLDASGVHPEAYPVVKEIEKKSGTTLTKLLGNSATLKSLDARDFTDEKFGLPTVQDILIELDKPGRDPRPKFQTASFSDGVESLKDLKLNLVLEGQVTNVTNFGAFVDIGVHQDGLVHISAMSDQFIKDPHQVVKTGDIVKVKVMSIEVERKRIGLSMRLSDDAQQAASGPTSAQRQARPKPPAKNNTSKDRDKNTPSALALALQASLDKKS